MKTASRPAPLTAQVQAYQGPLACRHLVDWLQEDGVISQDEADRTIARCSQGESSQPPLVRLAAVGILRQSDGQPLDLDELTQFLARRAGLTEVVLQGSGIRFHPVQLPESGQMRLTRLYPRTLVKPAVRTIVVPRPATAPLGGQPLRDTDLLTWAADLITAVLLPTMESTS